MNTRGSAQSHSENFPAQYNSRTGEELRNFELAFPLSADVAEGTGEFGSQEAAADDCYVLRSLGNRVEAPKVVGFPEESRVRGDGFTSRSQSR